jgi:hypothetical protein
LEAQSGKNAEAVSSSNIIHYIHEKFVLFLKLEDGLRISEERLLAVMVDRTLGLEDADKSLPMDSANYQDLCGHLHRQGVHTVPAYHAELPVFGKQGYGPSSRPNHL